RSNFVCQAEDGIRDRNVTGVQTCALPIYKTFIKECLLIKKCRPFFNLNTIFRSKQAMQIKQPPFLTYYYVYEELMLNLTKITKEIMVMKMDKNTKKSELEVKARQWLTERGVTLDDIAELVYYLQSSYHEDLSMEDCLENVDQVLTKREVQN